MDGSLDQWTFTALPMPARCAVSDGKWIIDGQFYLDGMGRRGSYPALYRWDGVQPRPEPALDLKAREYAAHYASRSGFCGALLKGETQSIPCVWEGGERRELDRGGHKFGIVHDSSGEQAVGIIRVPGEESWNSHDRAVLWDGDGKIVWLGPEGMGSLAGFTNGHRQVGELREGASRTRACLWDGSPETLQMLHPDDAVRSEATRIDGDRIIGWVSREIDDHPYEIYLPGFWHADTHAWTSLLPADGDWLGGMINDSRGGLAVGQLWNEVNENGSEINEHATLFRTDGGGHVDLHRFVDARYTRSQANSIAMTGSEVVVLGTAGMFDDRQTLLDKHAVLWRCRTGTP